MALGNFEQLCKMTRMAPEPLSVGPKGPPVKFKPVFFDPDEIEEGGPSIQSPPSLEPSMDNTRPSSFLPFEENRFYKDPMCPSFKEEEDKTEDSDSSEKDAEFPPKLGHHMRACRSKSSKGNIDKTVYGQMEAKRRLLEEQKKQHEIYAKQDTTHKEATALVNNLLQHGFHITPPDDMPQVAPTQDSDLGKASSVENEGEFVKSIHHELIRVQGRVYDLS